MSKIIRNCDWKAKEKYMFKISNSFIEIIYIKQIINRFPNSNYAKDSEQKIIFI